MCCCVCVCVYIYIIMYNAPCMYACYSLVLYTCYLYHYPYILKIYVPYACVLVIGEWMSQSLDNYTFEQNIICMLYISANIHWAHVHDDEVQYSMLPLSYRPGIIPSRKLFFIDNSDFADVLRKLHR